MKILGERVLLDWEVFNWLGYLGYNYIRIARPISPEFTKICSVPSVLEEKKQKENLNTLASLLSFSRNRTGLCQEIDRCCCLRYINSFHTQQFEQFPGRWLPCN